MLNNVTVPELQVLILKEHPYWDSMAVRRYAQNCCNTMDPRLEPALRSCIDTGETVDFRYKEFSLYQIQHMRAGRSCFSAIMMMDAYLKDETFGRALILRR